MIYSRNLRLNLRLHFRLLIVYTASSEIDYLMVTIMMTRMIVWTIAGQACAGCNLTAVADPEITHTQDIARDTGGGMRNEAISNSCGP